MVARPCSMNAELNGLESLGIKLDGNIATNGVQKYLGEVPYQASSSLACNFHRRSNSPQSGYKIT